MDALLWLYQHTASAETSDDAAAAAAAAAAATCWSCVTARRDEDSRLKMPHWVRSKTGRASGTVFLEILLSADVLSSHAMSYNCLASPFHRDKSSLSIRSLSSLAPDRRGSCTSS